MSSLTVIFPRVKVLQDRHFIRRDILWKTSELLLKSAITLTPSVIMQTFRRFLRKAVWTSTFSCVPPLMKTISTRIFSTGSLQTVQAFLHTVFLTRIAVSSTKWKSSRKELHTLMKQQRLRLIPFRSSTVSETTAAVLQSDILSF